MEGLEEPEAADNASSVVLGSDLREGRVIEESGRSRLKESTPEFSGI